MTSANPAAEIVSTSSAVMVSCGHHVSPGVRRKRSIEYAPPTPRHSTPDQTQRNPRGMCTIRSRRYRNPSVATGIECRRSKFSWFPSTNPRNRSTSVRAASKASRYESRKLNPKSPSWITTSLSRRRACLIASTAYAALACQSPASATREGAARKPSLGGPVPCGTGRRAAATRLPVGHRADAAPVGEACRHRIRRMPAESRISSTSRVDVRRATMILRAVGSTGPRLGQGSSPASAHSCSFARDRRRTGMVISMRGCAYRHCRRQLAKSLTRRPALPFSRGRPRFARMGSAPWWTR